MKYYLAPMEGLTTYNFRRAYHKYYGGVDKYFTPFLAVRNLSSKTSFLSRFDPHIPGIVVPGGPGLARQMPDHPAVIHRIPRGVRFGFLHSGYLPGRDLWLRAL